METLIAICVVAVIAWFFFDKRKKAKICNTKNENSEKQVCDTESSNENSLEQDDQDEVYQELSEEEEMKYAKTVQLVQFKCKMAESSLEGIDNSGSEHDLYEKERIEKTVKICLEHAQELEDEFYRSTALHSIADLVSKSGQFDRAQKMIDCIEVDFINDKAMETLQFERKNNLSKL